ncbi:MAG: DUF4397 domain-containing protein [Gemmataceae bacterium]
MRTDLSQSFRPVLESLEERSVPAAIQLIHNSPYEAAEAVDVFVEDVPVAENFMFREASPFLDLTPFFGEGDTTDIEVVITPAGDPTPVFEAELPITLGTNYVAIAIGDPASDGSEGSNPTFTVELSGVGQTEAEDGDKVDFYVFHGSPDAPPVDVVARDVAILVDDIAYTEFDPNGYLSVDPGTFTLDVTLAEDNDAVAATFEADLSGLAGGAAVIVASGFLSPEPGEDNFGLLAVLPTGTAFLLPVVVEGTRFTDVFTVSVEEGETNTLAIGQTFGDTAEFTFDPNQPFIIEAGRGFDRLYYRASSSDLSVPDITFRGGSWRDTVTVLGTEDDDVITIANGASGYVLEVNDSNLFVESVEALFAYGRGGSDVIDASDVADLGVFLSGDDGNDTLIGGGRGDFIVGGDGADSILGGAGADQLFGQDGDDELFGGRGNDLLSGGRGRDFLSGGRGFDFLLGGRGRDFLTGGFGF